MREIEFDVREREKERERVSWCFEPSQPQRISSGLRERQRQTDRGVTQKQHAHKLFKRHLLVILRISQQHSVSPGLGRTTNTVSTRSDKNGEHGTTPSHTPQQSIFTNQPRLITYIRIEQAGTCTGFRQQDPRDQDVGRYC